MTSVSSPPPPPPDTPWAHVQAPGREIVRVTLWHLAMPHAVGLVLGTWIGAWSLSSALSAGCAGLMLALGAWVAWPRWSARWFMWVVGFALLPLDVAIWMALGQTATTDFAIHAFIWALLVWGWGVPRARSLALASLLRGRIVSGPFWPWDGWRIPDELWRARTVPADIWARAIKAAGAADPVAPHEPDTTREISAARALLGLAPQGELDPGEIREAHDRLVGKLATLKPALKAADRARRLRELGQARETLLVAPAERIVAKVPRSAGEPRELVRRLEQLADSQGNAQIRREALQLAAFAWPGRLQAAMRRDPEAVWAACEGMDARWVKAWFPYGWGGLVSWEQGVLGLFGIGWPLLWVANLSGAPVGGIQTALGLGIGVWGILRLALGGAAVSAARARVVAPVKVPAREIPAPPPYIPGKLAPDDPGPLDRHHDYVVTKGGMASMFVWIPVFQAFQLIRPERCGYPDQAVGGWVARQPSTGARDVDWAVETFGGFYAGKFTASRADAWPGHPDTGSGATVGSSSTLKVAQYCVPWTDVNWNEAKAACAAYDPACHLMTDEEWTALAVWSMIHGVTVLGNNARGNYARDNHVSFVSDPHCNGRALTGSGKRTGWSGDVNLTTHTGKTDGVYDLNGNVWEWTATLGGAKFSNHYSLSGSDTGVSMPGHGPIVSLRTEARLRRYGMPGTTGHPAAFGGDYFYPNYSSLTASVRGGRWTDVSGAGVWALGLSVARSYSVDGVGFRPVLRF